MLSRRDWAKTHTLQLQILHMPRVHLFHFLMALIRFPNRTRGNTSSFLQLLIVRRVGGRFGYQSPHLGLFQVFRSRHDAGAKYLESGFQMVSRL
jgi:hypothetical protein